MNSLDENEDKMVDGKEIVDRLTSFNPSRLHVFDTHTGSDGPLWAVAIWLFKDKHLIDGEILALTNTLSTAFPERHSIQFEIFPETSVSYATLRLAVFGLRDIEPGKYVEVKDDVEQ